MGSRRNTHTHTHTCARHRPHRSLLFNQTPQTPAASPAGGLFLKNKKPAVEPTTRLLIRTPPKYTSVFTTSHTHPENRPSCPERPVCVFSFSLTAYVAVTSAVTSIRSLPRPVLACLRHHSDPAPRPPGWSPGSPRTPAVFSIYSFLPAWPRTSGSSVRPSLRPAYRVTCQDCGSRRGGSAPVISWKWLLTRGTAPSGPELPHGDAAQFHPPACSGLLLSPPPLLLPNPQASPPAD